MKERMVLNRARVANDMPGDFFLRQRCRCDAARYPRGEAHIPRAVRRNRAGGMRKQIDRWHTVDAHTLFDQRVIERFARKRIHIEQHFQSIRRRKIFQDAQVTQIAEQILLRKQEVLGQVAIAGEGIAWVRQQRLIT